jgi:hypothetical protein
MDGSRFDTWTRRRFGLAVGGLTGALQSLLQSPTAQAKKKRRRKRKEEKETSCKRLGDCCSPGETRKCCDNLPCRPLFGDQAFRCCHEAGEPCTIGEFDFTCCSGMCDGSECVCKTTGQSCSFDAQCCSFSCESSKCAAVT